MVRPVVAFENLMLLQIHAAANFDLDISTGTNFFFFFRQISKSNAPWR